MKKAFFTIALILAAIAAFIPPRGSRASAHTALAAPVVIDFENVAVGPLTNQYASLGITFNNPTVRSYQHLPGFAHSGVKGIEQCFAAEFCNAPIDISFTSGQRHVKVWVGYADPLSTSQTVLLRALDANGVQLGQATTVFAPSTVVRPVNTPVEITLPNANIRRALVSFSPTDIPISSLVMDDLEFDSAGQPPECPATQNPTLTMQQPLDNQIVQFDVFALGATATSQDPLATSMTLTVNGPGGATNSQQLPLASGNFGPMSMNGFLFPGLNTITLTFQDCRGTAQVSRTITYNPIPAGTRFGLLGIEVTQATQDTGNSVPLVANKPTMARVFLRIQSPAGPSAVINDVFGKLSAQRRVGGGLGDFLPPGNIESTNMITVNTSDSLGPKRVSLTATINFNLPTAWLAQGDLHLAFRPEIKGSPTSPSDIPCDNCDNLFPVNSQPHLVTFHLTRRMNLILAPYIYQPNPNPPFPLSSELLLTPAGALQWTNNVYPLPGNFPSDSVGINLIRILPMQTTTRNMQTQDGKDDFLDDVRSVYANLQSQGGLPNDTRLLAMVPCGCGGQAELNGHAGFADTWASENGPVVPSVHFEAYGNFWAHELGHTYGREHAGNSHGEADGGGFDESFPYFHGAIGAPGIAFITEGWRPGGTPFLINPGVTSPLERHAHDFMSYGHTDPPLNTGMWVSPYTYLNLWRVFRIQQTQTLDALARNDAQFDDQSAEPEIPQSAEAIEKVVAMGSFKADGSVTLQPFFRAVTAVTSSPGTSGEFSLELYDEQGRLLHQHRFDAKAFSHSDTGTMGFTEFVPWHTHAKRIVLKRQDVIMAERTVSSHAPTVHVISPNGGETLGKETNIIWEANDPDGDPLSYTVLYNNGADQTWWPVATGVTTNSIKVDTSLWPGSHQGRIMVRVTDGVNSAEDVSDSFFSVPRKSPMVAIINTEDSKDAKASGEPHLLGIAYDPEDGILPASSLIWTSDRDGQIGKGNQVKLNSLSAGAHTITLSVTNSQGQTSTTQVKNVVGRATPK